MTKTIQPLSLNLNNANKDLTINKSQKEDNMSLLLSLFDSLNNLYDKLTRLNDVIEKRNIEYFLYQNIKEQINEN